MFLFDVTKKFDQCCEALCRKDLTDPHSELNVDLLRFIKDHERRPLVLSSLCDQVLALENRFKSRADTKRRNQIIAATAQMFVSAVKKHRDQQMLSDLEKSRIKREAEKYDDAKSLIKEVRSDVKTTES